MPRLNTISATAALAITVLVYSSGVWAATQVVTSTKPLELLVRAVAGEDVEITTLVPAGASPHTYNMRPSQRRALENADVIFWVGPEMESFLSRLLAGEDFHQRTIMLMQDEDDHPEANHGHQEHASHDDDRQSGTHETAGHDHGEGEDPHIWLDPSLALEMVRTVHGALANMKGANTQALNENLTRFEANLEKTERQVRAKLETAVHDISLFAYHSAFTRFASHYGLPLEGVLTLNPELSPGARHISEVQDKLHKANHPCLLIEPQFNRQWWRSITRGLEVTFSTWDPLATDIQVTADGYNVFQHSIADAVLKCLPENTQH